MPPRQGQGGGGGRGGQGDDGRSKTLQYEDFSTGLVRAGSRSGIPETALWDCTNAQVIGPGSIATLPNPADPIVAGLDPPVVTMFDAVLFIDSVEQARLICIRADGSVDAIDPGSGAITNVCGAGVLSSAARIAVWRDTHVLFADPVNGYASWDADEEQFVQYPAHFTADTVNASSTITWTGGIPAAAIVAGMGVSGAGIPVGTTILSAIGTTIVLSANATATASGVDITIGTGAPSTPREIEVFEGRVWLITSTRGFQFTGPGSFTTFETVYAGGVATITDPVFPGQITTFKAAMQLLWVVGPAAINTISNVQVLAGLTTFQNENLVAGAGTPYGDSVQPLFRTLVFLGTPGVYAILGATPQKLSDTLDGLFASIEGAGSSPAGVFTLNNILVYAVLVEIRGLKRLLVYSRPTWSVGDQGDDLLWVTSVVRANGVLELWGTNGESIYQLFAGRAGDYEIAFKHFDYGAFTTRKTIRRWALEADITGFGDADIQIFLENEITSQQQVASVVQSEITWINNALSEITWVNNLALPITWVASGRIVRRGQGQFSGNLVSMRLIGDNSVPLIIGAFAWEIGITGEWVFEP